MLEKKSKKKRRKILKTGEPIKRKEKNAEVTRKRKVVKTPKNSTKKKSSHETEIP